MTLFDERERAFEARFAHDEDRRLIAVCRGHWLFGRWAAERIGLDGERADSFASDVARLGLNQKHGDAVFRRVCEHLRRAELNIPETEIEDAFAAMQAKAVGQLRFEELTRPEFQPMP